jgi:phosphoglycerol transferase MdoB-like AlkP superfamily enzyme
MAASMDLDKMMEMLLGRLETLDKLDDTTIVLFSDHNAYYYDFTFSIRELDPDDETNPENYHLPALIFDRKLKTALAQKGITQIEKFTTAYDIAPTVLNLFGIDYNPGWYTGTDLFSPEETILISKLTGIFNNHYYTIDGENVLYTAPGSTPEDWADFQRNLGKALEKKRYTDLMFEIDYFKVVRDSEEEN